MNLLKWLYPGINIKRWIVLFFLSMASVMLGLLCVFHSQLHGVFIYLLQLAQDFVWADFKTSYFIIIGILLIILGLFFVCLSLRGFSRSLVDIFVADDKQKLIDVIFSRRRLVKGAAVTVLGGGTGLSSLLRGIKQITGNCTAVVATTDDGGSSGRLREEFGIIPPGDLRNCITALADTEPLMAKLMQYRFDEGTSLGGHSFGNLFIAAMADVAGDMENGLNATNKVLKVRGSVMPATIESVTLAAQMEDGSFVRGETSITDAGKKIERLLLEPESPAATKSAVKAIMCADMLIVGPGSLYTSIITNLLIPEIKEAVLKSKAVKVYICNIMTQPGETDGYSAYDHVEAIYDHVGEYFFDFIVVNKQKVSEDLLEKYEQQGAFPVQNNNGMIMAMGASVIEANLISEENLVRHEPVRLAQTLIALMYRLRISGKGWKLLDYYFVRDSMRKVKKVLEGE